jgi:hypothetical protein
MGEIGEPCGMPVLTGLRSSLSPSKASYYYYYISVYACSL